LAEFADGTLSPDTDYHFVLLSARRLAPKVLFQSSEVMWSAGSFRTLPETSDVEPAAAPAPAPEARLPANLFALDDGEIVAVGDRTTSAGALKQDVLGDLGRLAEPTRSFALCAVARQCAAGDL
jgi:hypothetical protein